MRSYVGVMKDEVGLMKDENTRAPVTTAGPDATTPPAKQPQPRLLQAKPLPKEVGGAKGPEPTRYGDWEHRGRCTDF